MFYLLLSRYRTEENKIVVLKIVQQVKLSLHEIGKTDSYLVAFLGHFLSSVSSLLTFFKVYFPRVTTN